MADEPSEDQLGRKHTPGRGHRRKSDPVKKRRFVRRAARMRAAAQRTWEARKRVWDSMSGFDGVSGQNLIPVGSQHHGTGCHAQTFASVWDEINYLCDKAAYWWNYRKDRVRAAPYLRRLEPLIAQADPRQEAILGAACRALLADFEGDLSQEIHFAQHKLPLLEQLLRGRHERLGYDWNDVLDEYDVLAALYEEKGQLADARHAQSAWARIRKQLAAATAAGGPRRPERAAHQTAISREFRPMTACRIASLLASGTEMLYALGLGDRVVAVSHECDYPPQALGKPRVTRTLVDAGGSSRQIDDQVRAMSAGGAALYEIDRLTRPEHGCDRHGTSPRSSVTRLARLSLSPLSHAVSPPSPLH